MNGILGIIKIIVVSVGFLPKALLCAYIETIIIPIIVFI